MGLTTQGLAASHFGPPWTLPVGPLLTSSVVGNAGSQWSLAELYLGSLLLGVIVAELGGGGFDVIKSLGWSGLGEGGLSGTWAAALCLMTLCRLVIVALAYAQAFVRSRSQQS